MRTLMVFLQFAASTTLGAFLSSLPLVVVCVLLLLVAAGMVARNAFRLLAARGRRRRFLFDHLLGVL